MSFFCCCLILHDEVLCVSCVRVSFVVVWTCLLACRSTMCCLVYVLLLLLLFDPARLSNLCCLCWCLILLLIVLFLFFLLELAWLGILCVLRMSFFCYCWILCDEVFCVAFAFSLILHDQAFCPVLSCVCIAFVFVWSCITRYSTLSCVFFCLRSVWRHYVDPAWLYPVWSCVYVTFVLYCDYVVCSLTLVYF